MAGVPAGPRRWLRRRRRLNAPAHTGERALAVDEQLIGAPQDRKRALRALTTPGFTDKCVGRKPHQVCNHSPFPLGNGGLRNRRLDQKGRYRRCITTGGHWHVRCASLARISAIAPDFKKKTVKARKISQACGAPVTPA